jgi:glycosyltransferase involved in cell wall biosynthesis
MTEAQGTAILQDAPPRATVAPGARLRIAHFCTSLSSGGAERQACIAADLQRRRGHDVRVLTRLALVGEHAHYRFLLEPNGIPSRLIGSQWDDRFPAAWKANRLSEALFRRMPPDLAQTVADLVGELLTDPVDVLHCYVDDCNIPGAIAACLSGTPAVVLSFRNGNPSHFPGLLRPWMRPWYRVLYGRPGVRFASNSDVGARDYERWLKLDNGIVPVIRNAFVPPEIPPVDLVRSWRQQLGIPLGAPLVAGVFRLHPEKRPLYFLECVRRLRNLLPQVRVVMAGVGELESLVRQRITDLGLADTVVLLGQRRDVPTILAGSDVMLLVSDWEGTPNVLLEAQYCGCAPVATAIGGSREAISPGETGLLVSLNDPEQTARAVAELLLDPERRRRMAATGRAMVVHRFAPRALYEGNDALYRDALSDSLRSTRRSA